MFEATMDVSVKKLPGSKVEMSVSVGWDEWKDDADAAVRELGKGAEIRGFRPGKAPRQVIESRFGKATVMLEGAERAIRRLYPDALLREKVNGIGQPEIRLESADEGDTLSFVATVSVVPEVVIGKGWEKAVRAVNKRHAKEKPAVAPEEIETELGRIAESRAKFVTVDRAARSGDMLETDFDVTRDGVPIENGTGRKHPVVLGKGVFIPGFEEELVGMKAGEEKTFELTFPETYHVGELAGNRATFHVTVGSVQERQLPELTDEFAVSLGSFENLDALRRSVSEGMLEERKQKALERRRTETVEAIVEDAKAELPEMLVEGEVKRMIAEFGQQAAMTGMKLEDYLARLGKTEEEIAKEWLPQARKRILSELAIAKIADENEIKPDQQEVEEEMNRILSYAKGVEQAESDYDLPAIYALARNRIRNRMLLEWLETL